MAAVGAERHVQERVAGERVVVATVAVRDLVKDFPAGGKTVRALSGVSFEASGDSFVSIVGPSGCGKSTLLNVLARIEEPTSGTADVTRDGRRAKLGYVFQSPRLLPWRTVIDNLLFVQKDRSEERRRYCGRYLAMVGLQDVEEKFPGQLSGGMQQRVGIARAFSIEPDVLLMDEPFSHLDAITARSLRAELNKIWAATKKLVLFVTHDVGEAVELSGRIVILGRGGQLRDQIEVELPYPRDPADADVALMKADVMRRFEELDLVAT
jgi:NitT/TauT family transport system ATP-binding protein